MVLWLRELISQEPTPMETQASEEPHPSCTLSTPAHPPLTAGVNLHPKPPSPSPYIYIYMCMYLATARYIATSSNAPPRSSSSTPRRPATYLETKLPRNSVANRCRCAANTSSLPCSRFSLPAYHPRDDDYYDIPLERGYVILSFVPLPRRGYATPLGKVLIFLNG